MLSDKAKTEIFVEERPFFYDSVTDKLSHAETIARTDRLKPVTGQPYQKMQFKFDPVKIASVTTWTPAQEQTESRRFSL
jgi:hypothetical protein